VTEPVGIPEPVGIRETIGIREPVGIREPLGTAGFRLRVVSCNVGRVCGGSAPVVAAVRPLRPDVVVVQDGPWRLRWRTPTASLANALGLFYGGGGGASVGNAVLVSARVQVGDVVPIRFPLVPGRPARGAVLAHCRVGSARFAVAGARLSDEPDERAAQAASLARTLAAVTDPLILCGEFGIDADLTGMVDADLTGMVDADLTGMVKVDAAHPRPARAWILTGRGVRVTAFPAGSGTDEPTAADITLGPTSP
jgi:hypothetical protein